MNPALVDQVVQAVLYEGHILYPYRASAKKNRQRFTFGRVYPEAYHLAQNGAEPCLMQTECLAEGPAARLGVSVRFLHPMIREIGEVTAPLREMPDPDLVDFFLEVPELDVDGNVYQTWQEVVERTVTVPALALRSQAGQPATRVPFLFSATHNIEPIRSRQGRIAGVIVRRQAAVSGAVEIAVEQIDDAVFKIAARIFNQTPMSSPDLADPEAIMLRTFASTHTILHVENGAFLSSIDPPASHAAPVNACHNIGTWPILVGDKAKQERDTMVSSPIILYDYPIIAPESPGDLFDGSEIDEILTLRILTMTDEEKREMRRIDEQARRILERTEALAPQDLLRMHGTMREAGLAGEAFFNPATKLQSVCIDGVSLRCGDRVRVHPKSRADVMDMAVAGKIAIIESIEEDAENKAHLALVMEDDPGKDLGFLRQPGHRFFYGADEVEPVRDNA